MNIYFELLKVIKMTSLQISVSLAMEKLETFTQQVKIIESVPLSTPPGAAVMTLPHNYKTNLFISSYRGKRLYGNLFFIKLQA